MAKPILRLGPVDELDDEYDPLLGRSVRDEPMPVAASAAAPLDPDQSVFDEPEPVSENIWVEEPALVAAKPPAQTAQPSLLDWMESPAEAKEPEPEPSPEPEPVPDPELVAEIPPDAPELYEAEEDVRARGQR
jgi:hypothetical protein